MNISLVPACLRADMHRQTWLVEEEKMFKTENLIDRCTMRWLLDIGRGSSRPGGRLIIS